MSFTPLSRAAACALLLVPITAPVIGPARAQTLHDFVQAAASRSADLAASGDRRAAIAARQLAADAPTPGAPTLSGSYVTDQVLRNRQQREAQLSISTPIWLPGEGTASRRVAEAELTRATAQADSVRLKLAGEVRESLADFALAQAEVTIAERRLSDARTLEADVARRTRAREAAESDLLLARAERLAAEAELQERSAARAQSKIGFQALTGMAPVAKALDEPLPDDATKTHPRLEDAKGVMDVARANQTLTAIQARDNPELALIARRNRDIYGTVYDHSVGVELRIPFASDARNRPRQAAAQAELTEATAGYAAVERDIAAEQQKSRIAHDNAAAQRGLARERARLLAQQTALIQRGYQHGEIPLIDMLRARALAHDAEDAAARADIALAKARGRLNQTHGIIP